MRHVIKKSLPESGVRGILDLRNTIEIADQLAGAESVEGPVFDDSSTGFDDQIRDYDIGTTAAQRINSSMRPSSPATRPRFGSTDPNHLSAGDYPTHPRTTIETHIVGSAEASFVHRVEMRGTEYRVIVDSSAVSQRAGADGTHPSLATDTSANTNVETVEQRSQSNVSSNSRLALRHGMVVTFRCSVENDRGELVASTDDEKPICCIHGKGTVISGLERALRNRCAGDEFTLEVGPEDAYGPRRGPGAQPLPMSVFPDEFPFAVGASFIAEGPDGDYLPLWVVGIEDDEVLVDANHPLAGQTLRLHVQICEVRMSTRDEVERGHALADRSSTPIQPE